MSEYDLSEIVHENGSIRLKLRHWDGIDRPDWITSGPFTGEQARRWIEILSKLADEAQAYAETVAHERRAKLIADRDRLTNEIIAIDRALS